MFYLFSFFVHTIISSVHGYLSERGAVVAAAGTVAISFTHHERSGRLTTKIVRCLFFDT